MDPIFASYLQIPTNVLLTNSLYLDIYISFRKQKNEKKNKRKVGLWEKKNTFQLKPTFIWAIFGCCIFIFLTFYML